MVRYMWLLTIFLFLQFIANNDIPYRDVQLYINREPRRELYNWTNMNVQTLDTGADIGDNVRVILKIRLVLD